MATTLASGLEQKHSISKVIYHKYTTYPISTKTLVDSLFVPAIRLSTVGCYAFPVAGASVMNSTSPNFDTVN